MKSLLLSGLFIYFLSSQIFAIPISFALSSKHVKRDEPFFAEVRIEGIQRVSPDNNIFTLNGVNAIYSGVVTETKINNFNSSMQTTLRFSITHSKIGRFRVPPISVTVNGVSYVYPEEYFVVTSDRYTNSNPSHIYEFNTEKEDSGIGQKIIKFQTNKKEVYIGESIIGYYIFYSESPKIPVFERNPNESIQFPFFSSESLTVVQISYPAEVMLNIDSTNNVDKLFYAKPYPREIFALTPLKAGEFKVGSTKFDVIDTSGFRYTTITLDAEPVPVRVRELPREDPKTFSGEVGVFEVRMDYGGREIHRGNPWRGKVSFHGEGLCNRLKDPILNKIPRDYPGKIVSTGVERSRKFVEISQGKYGFQCEANFHYAAYLDKSSKEIPIKISFFNPNTGLYETKDIVFPAIQLMDNSELVVEGDSVDYSTEGVSQSFSMIFYFLLVGLVLGLGLYFYKVKVFPIQNAKKEYFRILEETSGNKTGLILEKSLEKYFSKEESQFLRRIKDKYPSYSFSKLYTILDYQERKIFDNFIQKGEKK